MLASILGSRFLRHPPPLFFKPLPFVFQVSHLHRQSFIVMSGVYIIILGELFGTSPALSLCFQSLCYAKVSHGVTVNRQT